LGALDTTRSITPARFIHQQPSSIQTWNRRTYHSVCFIYCLLPPEILRYHRSRTDKMSITKRIRVFDSIQWWVARARLLRNEQRIRNGAAGWNTTVPYT
jgi:hypothetical protein